MSGIRRFHDQLEVHIWGDMCPACALFLDLEGLMPMMAHQFLFSGSISGIWASTELCYGRGK